MVKIMGVCQGRHEIPGVTEYVFPHTVEDVLDYDHLYEMAAAAIPENCGYLKLYVTGLTPCVLAIVSVCSERGCALTAYHYDRETGDYVGQIVM